MNVKTNTTGSSMNARESISSCGVKRATISIEPKEAVTDKYHNIECCEWTRGIDILLSRYKQDREEITSLIYNDPDTLIKTIWKQDSPLAIDNGCKCQMGSGEIRSTFACAQCKNLRRLMDFRLGGVDKPFKVECGDLAGRNLIVSSNHVISPFLTYDDDSARRATNYIQQYRNLTMCGTPNSNDSDGRQCITGDSFTTRTLIMWMIYKIFSDKSLPHCPLMHTAFICHNTGYSLYDMPSIGTMSELHKIEAYHNIDPLNSRDGRSMKSQHFAYTPLKASIARTIIIQLLVALSELSSIYFSHGTPSIHGIIFTKDPVSYMYDGVHVEGPITFQLTDFWNASATFNGIHYFPKSVKSSMYIERNMFVPEIVTRSISMAHCYDRPQKNQVEIADNSIDAICKPERAVIYKLTNNTMEIYNAMRHIGFPLYAGSFDFYCFMVSLMCDKSFFDAVTNDIRLYSLWSMMWLVDDLPKIEQLIREAHDVETNGETPINNRAASNIVINIVRGAWLRCDIIKYIWSLIKTGW